MKKKLAIITTHPVQYNAPFFQRLAGEESLHPRVFYTWGAGAGKKYDPGFNRDIAWDIPLLDGYEAVFVENRAKDPGSHHFLGINNPTLIQDLEAWNPDAILVYGWAFKSHLQVLRHFKGKKTLLFRGDSTLIDRQSALKAGVRKLFLRWVYSHIDRAFYPGQQTKAYFEACGLWPSRLTWMPHAVDNERFRQGAAQGQVGLQQWREARALPLNALLFLYAGKFTAKKNVTLLMDAFQEAALENTCLVLVGNGPEEAALKKKAAGDKKIRFLPFQNQAAMPALLAAADVVVLPSAWGETWGLVLNEAMACGKPVLASEACGSAADLVVPGTNGYTFRNGDRADLVQKLRTVAENREEMKSMGAQSARIIQDWSFEKATAVLTEQMAKTKWTNL
ncbi:MAG TPA: glycosyltransferase [Flavisolibacter sp.]|jgi:glycosyltransferase involved in cell wall biosynthesis|nr:glycosyltransferase [Flavisolibacter sp.]